MKAREIHTAIDKIKCDLDNLRVQLWNQMAEEERWPKPQIKVCVVFFYNDDIGAEQIAGVFTTAAEAQRINNALEALDFNPEMGEYTLDQVYPPAS